MNKYDLGKQDGKISLIDLSAVLDMALAERTERVVTAFISVTLPVGWQDLGRAFYLPYKLV